MKQCRLGLDLCIKCRITNLEEIGYDNLTMILIDSRLNHIKIGEVNVTDTNVVTGYFWGKDLKIPGTYTVSIWRNWGLKGLTCLERIRAFELCHICPPNPIIELQSGPLYVGTQGESAYQSWLNLGNTGTEDDFINSLKADFNIDDADKDKLGELVMNLTENQFIEINNEITNLANKVSELENREDNDTIYDDTELRDRITELENNPVIPEVDLSDYYTKEEIDNLKPKNIQFDNTNLNKYLNLAYNSAKNGVEYSSSTLWLASLSSEDKEKVLNLKIGDVVEYLSIRYVIIDKRQVATNYYYTLLPCDDYSEVKLSPNYIQMIVSVMAIKFYTYSSLIQPKLTAGENITITNNVISATVPDVENYDDTEIQNRLTTLENKVDNDTIYDDTDIQNRLTALENKTDYDDTEIKSRISDLESINHNEFIKGEVLSEEEYSNLSELETDKVYLITGDENSVGGETYDDTEIRLLISEVNSRIDNLTDNDTVYDDTEVKSRLTVLENKVDNDTIYDDTEIQNRLTALENKVDNDTIYDDTAILDTIILLNDKIENLVDNDTVYDDTLIKLRLNVLENKVDNDTIYDDTEIQSRLTALENKTDYDDTELRARIVLLEAKEDADTIYDDTEIRDLISNMTLTISLLQDKVNALEAGNIDDLRVGVEITADPNTSYDMHNLFGGYYNSTITTDSQGKYFQEMELVPSNNASLWFGSVTDNLTSVKFLNVKTSNVTDMNSMFTNCSSLTNIELSCLLTNNVTDMHHMFCHCSSLTELDLSHFKTGKVTNMLSMFLQCSSLTELNVSTWNTINITNMSMMFNGCSSLTELDLSNWDVSNVTEFGSSYSNIFTGCTQLERIICTQATYNKFVANNVWPSGCEHVLPE